MRRAGLLTLSCSLLLGMVTAVTAQGRPNEPPASSSNPALVAISPDQDRELQRWLSAIEKWQRYDAKWRNRPAHNDWGQVVARRPPPEAPEWLAAHCALVTAGGVEFEHMLEACRLLSDPRAPLKAVPPPAQAARIKAEKPQKHSSFLTRVHLDGLWTTAAANGRAYGLVGSHVSLVDVGRLQIFGPPGVILLSVPEGDGSRRITLGYTWGVSVRLADVRMFGSTKNMTLFLNVSKVWVNGGDDRGNFQGYDIAGFSLAPRRKH